MLIIIEYVLRICIPVVKYINNFWNSKLVFCTNFSPFDVFFLGFFFNAGISCIRRKSFLTKVVWSLLGGSRKGDWQMPISVSVKFISKSLFILGADQEWITVSSKDFRAIVNWNQHATHTSNWGILLHGYLCTLVWFYNGYFV